MPTCPACEEPVTESASFCAQCGHELDGEEPPTYGAGIESLHRPIEVPWWLTPLLAVLSLFAAGYYWVITILARNPAIEWLLFTFLAVAAITVPLAIVTLARRFWR